MDPAPIAAFVTALSCVAALALNEPPQWGYRRIAYGVGTAALAVVLLQLAYSVWWWSGMLFGGYQVYLGWRFIDRRSRIASEKVEYVWATASVLGLIAVIDGELSAKDKEIIRAAYLRAGFSEVEMREVELTLSDCERTFVSGGSDPDRLFNMLREACAKVALHSNQQTRFIFLETAVALVGSDGFISSAEEKALRAAALMLGFSSEDVDKVRAMAHQPDAPATAI